MRTNIRCTILFHASVVFSYMLFYTHRLNIIIDEVSGFCIDYRTLNRVFMRDASPHVNFVALCCNLHPPAAVDGGKLMLTQKM